MEGKKVNVRTKLNKTEEKRENRSVGEQGCERGREGGGAEGGLSKNKTGQYADIQPPFSLPRFHFPVLLHEERAGNPRLASKTEG